ncbi:IclR family transcriptional regulator [Variovorax paradoxus]|jgi:DNA-binding IclR family transcriptional regulator|uniref:IclR family transcriptional regulator n=1 Tax=Variovorax paradoxus TaxID=34073 RepID=UPI0006E62075|nr:IclR family transcriptional regulator [Variovorax paradoxus]KPU96118.1 IclR family transcriptional regulator [Variovorax paradoxus]KPV01359.1 IclR family transcriptional regulator [Variovorax paradoxus]KPV17616.1 IclR family transcriptional regulator [Variovorax paradoxus]KPV25744.1 IclR family transcriptional regulator [Variovorax paradoxus]
MDSTLAKGLAVMEWMARQARACRVTDVANAFGMARSNAHRTLQTLVECGWAVQDADTSAYRPSLRLFELGAMVSEAADIGALLRPHLAALAQASGETIHLAVLDGAEIVYLDKFDSPLPVAAYSRIGGRAPACCVASGKAMLAAARLDAAALRALFGTLQPHTPHSIVDFDALQAELERSRARGYAENREEWRLGVCGLGVPVFDARGTAVAAVGMSVPSIRFARTQARELSERIMACARDASATLGYRPATAPATTTRRRPA